MHTKKRYHDVLESNNFDDTEKKAPNHERGSMDV
jgi:hypothetical protein